MNVTCVAYSPDGKSILSGDEKGTLHLWDVASSRLVCTFSGHTDSVQSVAFSPDGRTLLSGSGDKTTRLWEIATGRELRRFDGHSGLVWSVAFSPDGQLALSGSADSTLRLWNIATGRELQRFEGHRRDVLSVAFSPRSHAVLSGGSDRTVRLWDAATGKEIYIFKGHSRSVWSAVFAPDGMSFLSGDEDGTLSLWNAGHIFLACELPSSSSHLAQFVSSMTMVGIETRAIPPHHNEKWLTPDGKPPAFLRVPLPSWSLDDSAELEGDAKRWLAEWREITTRNHREEIDTWNRRWSAQFEGYRYREESGEGGVKRVPVPPRPKDEFGRYIGEPEGFIDYTRWWQENQAPKYK